MSDRPYVPLDPRLLDGAHMRRMGMSVYLLAFFIHKQTDPGGSVYYGRAITYRWIRDSIRNCPPERTLQMWLSTLRTNGYIEVSHERGGGMRVRIIDSQKWPTAQLDLFNEGLSKSCDTREEKLSNCGNPPPQLFAGGVRRMLRGILILEKDKNSEKRKSAAQIAAECVEREYPGIKARQITSHPRIVLEEKKKIS